MIRELTENEVEFQIFVHPEEMPVRGNVVNSGDEKFDRRCENRILSALERGNEWAWCCVEVRAIWKDFFGKDFLGACSYKNEADFRKGGYFEDMKAEALRGLNKHLAQINELLEDGPPPPAPAVSGTPRRTASPRAPGM